MTLDPEATLASRQSRVREIALFLLTGGLAALVNLISRFLLTPAIGFEAAIIAAYVIGMIVAYLLFRALVFAGSTNSISQQTVRFVIVNIVALIAVTVVTLLLARVIFPLIGFTWHAEDIAHIIGVCVPAITSYIGHSRYTFSRNTT